MNALPPLRLYIPMEVGSLLCWSVVLGLRRVLTAC